MAVPPSSLLITAVGKYVESYLREQKLILFSDSVSDDIAMYCALHPGCKLTAELSVGQIMKINRSPYRITAVGSAATENLTRLGHITLNFNGAVIAELPGTLHLSGEAPYSVRVGDRIFFC